MYLPTLLLRNSTLFHYLVLLQDINIILVLFRNSALFQYRVLLQDLALLHISA